MSGQPSRGVERYAPRHSIPATKSDIHASPMAKNRRRISGLGYIRDNGTNHQQRSISHHAKPSEANDVRRMDWSSPDLYSDLFWSHRSSGAASLSGFTPVDTIKANNGWPVPTLHRDARIYTFPRYDCYESHAPSHTTSVSSPPSSNSPIFSESVATTNSSTETAQVHRFQPVHDPFAMSPLLQSIPASSPSLTKSPTMQRRSQASRTQGISGDILRRSHSRSSSHDEHVSPSVHGGLDRWFPGLMYAFDAQESPNTTPRSEDQDAQLGPDDSVDNFAVPVTKPHSPPLRSLQLVSKYFGEELQEDSFVSMHSMYDGGRSISPGEMHGLGVSFSPSLSEDMTAQAPERNTSRLRPLHLAERYGLEGSPQLHGCTGEEDESIDDSFPSGPPTRVPFSVLHPPAEKRKPDPDAIRLYWFGFLGMPWLWLLGSWCIDDHGVLLSPWSPPSFASYRAGLHPYGPPFALSMRAHSQFLQRCVQQTTQGPHAITQEPHVFGEDHRGVRFLSQYPPDSVPLHKVHQWQHTESFVLLNRMAAVLSSFALFACWTNGVWPVMAHF